MTSHLQTRQRRRESAASAEGPLCSKCDSTNDRAPQRYCSGCHANYQREWRKGRVTVSRETFCFMTGRMA